jgi:hypothetical protein
MVGALLHGRLNVDNDNVLHILKIYKKDSECLNHKWQMFELIGMFKLI